MLKIIFSVIARDLQLAMRRQADIVSALFFFVIVVSLFPLGIGPETDLLRKLAPGVLWVAALLATMLSLPRLFADDHRDGTLEQLALSPQPLGLMPYSLWGGREGQARRVPFPRCARQPLSLLCRALHGGS